MNDNLNETLLALRKEIDALNGAETEHKDRLEKLVADIEVAIGSPEDFENNGDLVEDIKDSVTYFEVSHPAVTGILNDLMMALSNMGI